MDLVDACAFIKDNPRCIFATRRKDGSTQMSPVVAAVDDDGQLLISSRETAYKTMNIRRDARVSACFVNEGFFGQWIQVDGFADIISLPEAMDVLVDYYRRLSGEHQNWDEYRAAMIKEKRLVLRVKIEHAGPDRSG